MASLKSLTNLLLQICVPLILQNKLMLAESFVQGHSHLEKRLVTLLDSWCHPSFSVEEISRYGARVNVVEHRCVGNGVPLYEVTRPCALVCFRRRFPRLSVSKQCMNQIQPKMLTKQVFRLMEKFNIDQGAFIADGVWLHTSGRRECDLVFVLNRTVSQRSAQEEIGLFAFPHVREVCGGK